MKFFAAFFLLFLSACAPDVARYKDQQPILRPDDFFNGQLTAYGVVENWRGAATKRFRMDATARWSGNTGTMDESFVYSDGTTQNRHWDFRKIDATHFVGTAPDVIGEAVGEVSGNALHWVYTITVTTDGKKRNVTFDDWLYLVDDDRHLFSLVTIKKFGLPVGRLTMFFAKEPS